ncbi:GSCFA domain-containing protein [Paracoccus sp. 11-3]|uniref:GSCFA domain-containing protein n=1 Tax=Paracoccus amoyensis TaxID=2760093 RepID=A0A926J5P1_9RHOB|nr:GSCFA domain-containing protein [Paracoccus amoyensis]MBC9246427.1 GSCFA domain-containing protein [Paracoccus amoyensis]
MTHPYADLPPQAFWRSGVADADPAALDGIYQPAFPLGDDARIATAGSCFAQHISRALQGAGMQVLDVEPAPNTEAPELARSFNYGVYSARYGNIYTTRQLLQLLQDSETGHVELAEIWQRDGRFFDAQRPNIEPVGFVSVDEAILLRQAHLAAVQRLFRMATHLIFTLGLVECWFDQETGRVMPLAPGVVAGEYDPGRYSLRRLGFAEVLHDLQQMRQHLHRHNPSLRLILTVSPVPLTATATGQHVLPATTNAKAILRAAAGEFADSHEDVDYFPSYEIVTNPAARGRFYMPNSRDVTQQGVDAVTTTFLRAHGLTGGAGPAVATATSDDAATDLVCEEILLEAHRK